MSPWRTFYEHIVVCTKQYIDFYETNIKRLKLLLGRMFNNFRIKLVLLFEHHLVPQVVVYGFDLFFVWSITLPIVIRFFMVLEERFLSLASWLWLNKNKSWHSENDFATLRIKTLTKRFSSSHRSQYHNYRLRYLTSKIRFKKLNIVTSISFDQQF